MEVATLVNSDNIPHKGTRSNPKHPASGKEKQLGDPQAREATKSHKNILGNNRAVQALTPVTKNQADVPAKIGKLLEEKTKQFEPAVHAGHINKWAPT